jgi:acetate kinase
MRVLVVNAGSSSLKLSVLDESDEVVEQHDLEQWDGAAQDIARAAGGWSCDAIGHRVVHGGPHLTQPVVVDEPVRDQIAAVTPLAPLHQPRALAGIDATRTAWPHLPSVACFDTAFHATMPEASATYAVPADWRDRWPIRRYGFHGLSHRYASRRAAQLMGRPVEGLRLVTCHLGAGASLCAVKDGRSIDTTMGFTPLEGLVMATRSGTIDPGLVLWLVREAGLSPGRVNDALEHESGVLALAGTAKLEEVTDRATRPSVECDDRAVLALDVYVHRLVREFGAMVAVMGGVDGIVFTGGVGEHSSVVRSRTMNALAQFGISLDEGRNDRARGDCVVSTPESEVAVIVVESREDIEIARQVRGILS